MEIMLSFIISGLGLLAVLASLFFWSPGQNFIRGGIPPSLINSMIIASIAFALTTWLTVLKAAKLTKISIFILLGLAFWYSTVFLLSKIGFFGKNPLIFPNIIFGFIALYYFGKRILKSPRLIQIASAIPPHYIMNIQVFRVMGVGFLSLYLMGVLPGVFAIPTGIGDILVGLTGPIVGFLYQKDKNRWHKLAIHWHKAGIFDLILAVVLANITYSRPIHLLPTKIASDPIALFPLVLIPLFAVPLSILLHLFSLQALKKE